MAADDGASGVSLPDEEAELFTSLSQRLREAHRRVGGLQASDEQKARTTRRLLAISDASKHDLGRASARLDALVADLDADRFPGADGSPTGATDAGEGPAARELPATQGNS